MCPTKEGIGGTEHFLLHVSSFYKEQCDLLAGVFALLQPFGYINPSCKVLVELLLYCDKDLLYDLNRIMILPTLQFIRKTCRFVYLPPPLSFSSFFL